MNNEQDFVKVVRCKDCRYYEQFYYDEEIGVPIPPFCELYDAHFDNPPFYFGADNRSNEYGYYDPYDYYDNGFCAWGEHKLSDDEINEIYNSNVSEDIEDIVEYGIMSKEDIAYTIVRQKQMD